jgi:hypothetical protein
MSLADAELLAPSTERDGPRPAEGSWDKKRAARKAEVDRKAAERRRSVLDRIPAGGITRARLTAKLVQALGSSWQTGVGAALQELIASGEAHEIDGAVFRGPGPTRAAAAAAASLPTSSTTASVEARARVMALARTQTWWFRRQLVQAVTSSPIWDVARAVSELLAEGELEEMDGSRIRVRPLPAESTAAPARAVTPALAMPETSVGPSRPVGGDTSSSLDSGATAEREPSAGEREDGPAAAQCDSVVPSVGLEQQPNAASDGEPVQPDRTETSAAEAHPETDPSDDPRLTGPAMDGVLLEGRLTGSPGVNEDQAGAADLVVTGGASPSGFHRRARPSPRRDQVAALVTAEPGLTTGEIADRLGIERQRAGQVCRDLGLRNEFERDPEAAGGRGVSVARWYPAELVEECEPPAPAPILEPIGAWVRRRRAELGLSQRQLGELAGIPCGQAVVSTLERGLRHETAHLAALESALGPRGPYNPDAGCPRPAQPSAPASAMESSRPEEPAATPAADPEVDHVIAGEVLALDGHGAGVGVQSFRPGEEETEPGDESAPSPGPPVSSSPSDSERVLGARGGLEGDDSPVPGPVPRPPC